MISKRNEPAWRDPSSETLYGSYSTQEALDAVYNVEKAVADFSGYIRYYQDASVRAREVLENRVVISYGPTIMERLIVYPGSSRNAPVFVFVHGGYWRMGLGEDYDFIATGSVEAGYTTVVITYALAPHVSIPEIIRQVRASIAWTAKNISSYNGDPGNIYVGGHSAGAHLAVMAANTHWPDYGLEPETIKGILAVSGLYDLEPVSHSFIQPVLRITAEQILNSSPIRLIRPSVIPMIIAWGSVETDAFKQQSDNYLRAWQSAGNHGLPMIVDGADHFSILKEFEMKDGLFVNAVNALMKKSLNQ